MNRIIDYKATGKTHSLLAVANETNGVIVSQNPYAMREKAHAYGFTNGKCEFISYNDFFNHRYDNHKPVYIDELETCIKSIGRLDGYTLSKE